MNIIYEDEFIIVINKPAGLATQSANIIQKDCVSLIKEHLKKTDSKLKNEPYLGIIHRLDQPVGGILVFAKTKEAAANLSKQVQTDIMNKCYEAVVEGRVPEEEEKEQQLVNYIYKDSKDSRAVVVEDNKTNKDAKKAELSYRVISYDAQSNTSHLFIRLKTGRFHQIRAQLSYLGHPIVGDRKYGSTSVYQRDFQTMEPLARGAIALKAVELTFKHPKNGKVMTFR